MYFQRASGYEMAGNDASALQDMNEAVAIALRKKHTMMYELYVKRAPFINALVTFQKL